MAERIGNSKWGSLAFFFFFFFYGYKSRPGVPLRLTTNFSCASLSLSFSLDAFRCVRESLSKSWSALVSKQRGCVTRQRTETHAMRFEMVSFRHRGLFLACADQPSIRPLPILSPAGWIKGREGIGVGCVHASSGAFLSTRISLPFFSSPRV